MINVFNLLVLIGIEMELSGSLVMWFKKENTTAVWLVNIYEENPPPCLVSEAVRGAMPPKGY